MIVGFRTGIGSLVGQWLGRTRSRTPPRQTQDRQGGRAQLLSTDGVVSSRWLGVHASVAMQRFTAHALDANLADLRDEATDAELAALEPAARVLDDLELQAKYLPRRPSLLPQLMS